MNKQYWKVTDGSSYCVWGTLKEAQDMIADLDDWFLDEYFYSIEEVWMTEEEFNNLNEFEGF